MIVGFTGTREGMTPTQILTTARAVRLLNPSEGRHGDCVGSDAEFDGILKDLGIRRVIHPPIKDELRAFCGGDVILPPKDYLARDMDIVDECNFLLATPKAATLDARSGTGYTAAYARSMKRRTLIIYPDGTIERRFHPASFLPL